MITQEKIAIYKKYSGDIDHFARVGSSRDKSILSDFEWNQIDNLIQDLELSLKGLTSREFDINIKERIAEIVDSNETLEQIKKLVNQ